ncbi:DNA primase [Candidatus Sumerlaeota bacterium]|nr:DNA primase [Candidatus Sumerlaeota bacterium]
MPSPVEFAETLRQRIDIVDVVQGYVRLKQSGANHKGCCPFHQEKTPSFMVSSSKQIFHCFGCGKGGDALKFIMEIEHLTWMEALRFLAEKYGITVPNFGGAHSEHNAQETRTKRDIQFRICQYAQDFFAHTLQAEISNLNTEAAVYMQRRALSPELCGHFHLGLAPTSGWRNLLESAVRQNIATQADMVESGLVIEKDSNTYDRFRNRIIFPIHDANGRPVAFGGRVYHSSAKPDDPKYINSPETQLYHKGQQLYALHLARPEIQKRNCALLMEGYMDVIRCHQYGFTNAVASCGTALTEQQARLLNRFTKEVILIYDGDSAGQKAMLRAAEILLPMEFKLSFVVLPNEHDPDSYLREYGAEPFAALISQGRNVLQFLWGLAQAHWNLASPEDKHRTATFILSYILRIPSPVTREDYIRQLANGLAVSIESINQLSKQIVTQQPMEQQTQEKLRNEFYRHENEPRNETLLLITAVEDAEMRKLILEHLNIEWLQGRKTGQLFRLLTELVGTADEVSWNTLLEKCPDEALRVFCTQTAMTDCMEFKVERTSQERENALRNLITRIELRHGKRHVKAISQTLHDLNKPDTDSEQIEKQLQAFDLYAHKNVEIKNRCKGK